MEALTTEICFAGLIFGAILSVIVAIEWSRIL